MASLSDNISNRRGDWTDQMLILFGIVCLIVGFAVVYGRQNTQLEKQRREIACLRHPELWVGGTSSATAVRGADGRFHTKLNGRDAVCR